MTTLGECVGGLKRVIGGPFGSNLTSADYRPVGVPVIRGSNMEQNGRWIGGEFAFVSAEKAASDLRSNMARRGDIIVTQRGTMGQVSIVPDDAASEQFVISQSQMAISVDESCASRDFVYYYLRSPQFAEYLTQSIIQTGVPHINLGILRQAPADWPDPDTQQVIAGLLSILDDKIELNRRMNHTLEAMAQAIFRDWFVDFAPVRRKLAGATDPVAIMGGLMPDAARAAELAALFPGALGDNGLPEGWAETPLDQIADFLNGLALQKFPAVNGEPSLPVIKIAELRNGLSDKSNRASRLLPDRYIIQNGDYLFSWSGSLMAKVWTEGKGALNQHLFKVSSSKYPQWFYAAWVQHHMAEFQQIAASKATTMGHIQRGHLSAAKTVCPPGATIDAMSAVLGPLWSRGIHNDLVNRTLAETRDYLLPRLMSGEVRVLDASQEIAA